MIAWVATAAAVAPADAYVCPTGPNFAVCCGALAAGAPCHDRLQDALDGVPTGAVVALAPGTFPNAVDITRDVTLRPARDFSTPILSTADPQERAVIEVAGPVVVRLEGLLIASAATRALEVRGGAEVTVANTTMLVSGARDFGGAVRVDDSTLRLERSLIDGGTAAKSGGQIYADGSRLELVGTRLFGGTAVRSGGAVFAEGSSTLDIVDCVFAEGTAYVDGGALALDDGASATIRGASFLDDRSLRSGGALWLGDGASAQLVDSRFIENEAVVAGGAIAVDRGSLGLDRCELSLNRVVGEAATGGAIWLYDVDVDADVTWTNDRFVENLATVGGGALFVATEGRVHLAQATLLGNAAADGGALAARGGGRVSLSGSVVAWSASGGGVSDPGGRSSASGTVWFDNAGGDWLPAAVPLAGDGNRVGVDPVYFGYSRDGRLADDDFGYHPGQSPLVGAADGSDLDGTPGDAGDAGGPDADPAVWGDGDGDGWPSVHDCNDRDAAVHPGAAEAADGLDADCDGSDGVDLDRDGFDAAVDCDDLDPGTFPGAVEDPSLARDMDCDGWATPRQPVEPAGCDHVGGSFAASLVAALTARRRSASSRGTSRPGARRAPRSPSPGR